MGNCISSDPFFELFEEEGENPHALDWEWPKRKGEAERVRAGLFGTVQRQVDVLELDGRGYMLKVTTPNGELKAHINLMHTDVHGDVILEEDSHDGQVDGVREQVRATQRGGVCVCVMPCA